MATQNEILASSSNLKGIVDEFNNSLSDFIEEMSNSVSEVQRSVETLGNYWKDEGAYRSFKDKIMKEMRSIETQNERGKQLSSKLNELSQKFGRLIEYLEAAGAGK